MASVKCHHVLSLISNTKTELIRIIQIIVKCKLVNEQISIKVYHHDFSSGNGMTRYKFGDFFHDFQNLEVSLSIFF
jgi:hypothetical protein